MSAQPKPRPEIVILPPELHQLAETLDGVKLPENAAIWAAIMPSGEVVGRTSLMTLVFIEGTFVAESHRGTSLAMRLVASAEGGAKESGLTHLLAMSPNEEVSSYLKRFGYEQLPVTIWAKDLNKGGK